MTFVNPRISAVSFAQHRDRAPQQREDERMTYATPKVQATARRFGVELAKVKGTGAGGRITVADVRAAAGLPATPVRPLRPVAAAPAAAGRVLEHVSRFVPTERVQYDAYAANPLLEDLRQAMPQAYRAALASSIPTPTLFEAGDLPLFTTSGIEPRLLLQLPWMARHRAAAADRAEAQRIFDRYAVSTQAGRDKAVDDAELSFGADPGNHAYWLRLRNWARSTSYDGRREDPKW